MLCVTISKDCYLRQYGHTNYLERRVKLKFICKIESDSN